MTFKEFETNVKKYIIIRDKYVLKLIAAASIAAYCEQFDPVWLVLVTSTSGGKSELTSPMTGLQFLYELDDLTPNTLISGMKNTKGQATSLLERWKMDRIKMVLTKDFTTILSKDTKEIGSILGQFRQTYDGRLGKEFGNSTKSVAYSIKFGWIACCTTSWYTATRTYASLGERFLSYEVLIADQPEVGRLVLRRRNTDFRDELKRLYSSYLNPLLLQCKGKLSTENFAEETENDLIALTDLTSHCRTAVDRTGYKQEIQMVHAREGLGRITTVVGTLARCLAYINKTDGLDESLTEEDMFLLARLCFTAIPQARRTALFTLAHFNGSANYKDMQLAGNASKEAIEDLEAIGIIKKTAGFGHVEWKMDQAHVTMLNRWRHVMGDTIITDFSRSERALLSRDV